MSVKSLSYSAYPACPQPKGQPLHLLQREYPGLVLRLSHGPALGWRLAARGPYGALTMLIPGVLRGAYITAACQLVCRNNLEARRGPTAAGVIKNRREAHNG